MPGPPLKPVRRRRGPMTSNQKPRAQPLPRKQLPGARHGMVQQTQSLRVEQDRVSSVSRSACSGNCQGLLGGVPRRRAATWEVSVSTSQPWPSGFTKRRDRASLEEAPRSAASMLEAPPLLVARASPESGRSAMRGQADVVSSRSEPQTRGSKAVSSPPPSGVEPPKKGLQLLPRV